MKDSLVVVCECSDAFRAETIRIRLAAAGIQTIVTGTDAAAALSLGGAGTDRLVRVEVAAQDHEPAMELLRADEERLQNAEPWICARCHERNEPAFEVCWSCNKGHTDEDRVGRIIDDDEESRGGRSSEEPGDLTAPPVTAQTPIDDRNPYRPVLLADGARKATPVNQRPQLTQELKDSVRRAFYSSIVGTLVFPPLVSFYSIYLILNVPLDGYSDRSLGSRLLVAWIINMINIPLWMVFWLGFSR